MILNGEVISSPLFVSLPPVDLLILFVLLSAIAAVQCQQKGTVLIPS